MKIVDKRPLIDSNCTNCKSLANYCDSLKRFSDKLQLDLNLTHSQLELSNSLIGSLENIHKESGKSHSEESLDSLLLKMDALKKEKGNIWNQIEREEEFLTNNLQKKVKKLELEKSLLEKFVQSHFPSELTFPIVDYEKLSMEMKKQSDLEKQVKELKSENLILKQKLYRDEEKIEEIVHEKGHLAKALECDEDRIFNLRAYASSSSSQSSSSRDDCSMHLSHPGNEREKKRSSSAHGLPVTFNTSLSPMESPIITRTRTQSADPAMRGRIEFVSGNHKKLYEKGWFAKKSPSLSNKK